MKKAFVKPVIQRIELNLTENIAYSIGVLVQVYDTWEADPGYNLCYAYIYGTKGDYNHSVSSAWYLAQENPLAATRDILGIDPISYYDACAHGKHMNVTAEGSDSTDGSLPLAMPLSY